MWCPTTLMVQNLRTQSINLNEVAVRFGQGSNLVEKKIAPWVELCSLHVREFTYQLSGVKFSLVRNPLPEDSPLLGELLRLVEELTREVEPPLTEILHNPYLCSKQVEILGQIVAELVALTSKVA